MTDQMHAPQESGNVVLVDRPRNGMAIASMVLGIIAVVFVWIPLLNMISLVLAVIAIGLGIPALIRAKRVHKGMGQAIAGVVLAVVSGIGFFAVNAATVSAIDGAVNEINDAMDATDQINTTIGKPSFDGFTTKAPITVVNTGSTSDSFVITVKAESADGATVYDTATVITPTLAPGQTYEDNALFLTELPSDAVLTVTEAF